MERGHPRPHERAARTQQACSARFADKDARAPYGALRFALPLFTFRTFRGKLRGNFPRFEIEFG